MVVFSVTRFTHKHANAPTSPTIIVAKKMWCIASMKASKSDARRTGGNSLKKC